MPRLVSAFAAAAVLSVLCAAPTLAQTSAPAQSDGWTYLTPIAGGCLIRSPQPPPSAETLAHATWSGECRPDAPISGQGTLTVPITTQLNGETIAATVAATGWYVDGVPNGVFVARASGGGAEKTNQMTLNMGCQVDVPTRCRPHIPPPGAVLTPP